MVAIILTLACMAFCFLSYVQGYWHGRSDELEKKDDPFGEIKRMRGGE